MSATLTLGFPLCADPRRDNAVRPLVGRAVSFLLHQLGTTYLEAVILTGSLARGEGSVLLLPNGFRLLGDVELLVILRSPFDWPAARRRMADLSRLATGELGEAGRLASIEYAPAGIGYLRRNIRPCIFAHDLLRHGKVVWGRSDVLGENRPFGVESIPREDAVNLIMNRMMELLLMEPQPRENSFEAEASAYQLVKTILDLSGSALAFAGRYVSRYGERRNAFVALLASNPDLRTALPAPEEFQEELDLATRCKLAPTEELLCRQYRAERLQSVLAWAKGFWLWEMRQLFGWPSAGFAELLDAYVRHETFWQRLKGWAKYCRHPLRPPGAMAPVRAGRLLLRASPQTLTYAAALLALEGNEERPHTWQARAASLLPVRPANGAVMQEVGELWRWLIRNN